ncbi:MAG: hypothetical protein IKB65_03195 [Ruminiclostridium sp.]|nr:hypothetical protein [Ruminiclostridium sp.]
MEQIFRIDHGTLVCRTRGNQVEVTMTLRPPGPGLYRGILCGKNGKLDLGTLLPEGEDLRLCRTLTVDHLARCGCWPVTGGRGELRYPFGAKRFPQGWGERGGLSGLFTDPVLARSVDKIALWRQDRDGFSLAFPWNPKAPFPLAPAFCFARVEEMEGRPWVVFSFREGGWPVVPPSCQSCDFAVQ